MFTESPSSSAGGGREMNAAGWIRCVSGLIHFLRDMARYTIAEQGSLSMVCHAVQVSWSLFDPAQPVGETFRRYIFRRVVVANLMINVCHALSRRWND